MSKKPIDEIRHIRSSLVGFNGTHWGRRCDTGGELAEAWQLRQLSLKRHSNVKIFLEHQDMFFRLCHKLKQPS